MTSQTERTATMTTTKELLAQLNALRIENGKAELASWKSSREKLEAAISELQPTDTTDPTMPMGENGNELVDELPKPKRMTPDELLRSKGAITAKEFFSQVPGHEDYQPVSKPAQQPAVSDPTDHEVGQAEVKIPRGAINAMCVELLQTDMPYEDIVAAIKERYPTARTTARSLASVAMDLRADGLTVPTRRKQAAAKDKRAEGEARGPLRPTSGRTSADQPASRPHARLAGCGPRSMGHLLSVQPPGPRCACDRPRTGHDRPRGLEVRPPDGLSRCFS